MSSVESTPVATVSTAPPEPQDDLRPPLTPNIELEEAARTELAGAHADRRLENSSAVTVELLRDGAVSQKTRDERNAILQRESELNEIILLRQPLADRERLEVLRYKQRVGFAQRVKNQAIAARVKEKLDDLNRQVAECEDEWVKAKNLPDGTFSASLLLTRFLKAHPEIEG